MRATTAIAISLCAALGGCSCSKRKAAPKSDTTPQTTRPKLVRAEPLAAPVRSALRQRMTEHGDDMESLLWSALMLDHETAASIAERIAQTPRIARAEAGDDSAVGRGLPERFFELQDELHAGAVALRAAARASDDAEVATQFARISNACIRCHSLYLKLPPIPEQ